MATHFDGLGTPSGGCGVPEGLVDSPDYVALNVQNTPGDYKSMYPRPLTGAAAGLVGEFDNGHNCGRWVSVTLEEACSTSNDGMPGKGFCPGGTWDPNGATGATLNLLVTDSCQDNNGWCRDDRYHLDLSTASLSHFKKDGQAVSIPVGTWGNPKIRWQFIPAPGYQGGVRFHFVAGASPYWPAILITHLPNGLHGVEVQGKNGAWAPADMLSDQGQVYIMPVDGGSPVKDFKIRLRDASDQLVEQGRIYQLTLPASCANKCPGYTEVKP